MKHSAELAHTEISNKYDYKKRIGKKGEGQI